MVVDQSVLEENLRIVGSRAALRRAQRELERYPISLAAANPGESRFSITPERLSMPRGARVTARAPSSVTVQLEPVRKKRVPVRADVFGSPAEGYRLVEVRVEPDRVLLEGARTKIRRIAEVRTDRLDLSRLHETSVYELPLIFGVPHVWQSERRGQPVKVEVVIEPVEKPAGEAGAS